MTLIIAESDNSEIFVKSESDNKKIVVLFPMTRIGASSILRWETLIETVNSSQVSNLVLIDKTENYVATEYFVRNEERITPKLVILQRPLSESIHDSQRFIRMQDGSWIIQFHDDDAWAGFLEIPDGIESNSVIKTQFKMVNGKEHLDVTDPAWPDCRSIFSLLPARLWNRFIELIHEQGGHVAGSIDSSLNLVVNLLAETHILSNFTYIYDNRHWSTRRSSAKSLTRLTREDGWRTFPTIQMSLVGRVIDGIASLIFFKEFYTYDELDRKLNDWIAGSKPNTLRIFSRSVYYSFLCAVRRISKISSNKATNFLSARCNLSMNYSHILLKAWKAANTCEYIEIIDELATSEPSEELQVRFIFWKSQLLPYSQRTLKP